MANNNSSSTTRNSGDSGQSSSSFQNANGKGAEQMQVSKASDQKAGAARLNSSEGAGKEGGQLEGFIVYLKDNWKPILTELVAVGVTT